MVRRGLLGALFPFLIAGAAGCGSSSPTAPVADPTVVSDTFTGTINPLGTDSHTFTVGYAGGTSNASVTVVALATVANQTPQTITIGVGFGSLNQGVCTAALTIPAAAVGAELATTSSPFLAGAYCVLVFDNPAAPTVTEPLTYTIKVNHF
jgi:hypothetical protein